jgi:glycosyltransferase involved in cell wall biosynthesis
VTHVLMTADTVGGVWTYAIELADALAPRGVSVSLATMGRPLSDEQRRQVSGSAVASLHESSFALEWMDDPWSDVDRAGEWLLDLEGQLRPDLLHLNGYAHAALPWRAPTVVVAHSCVCSWWEAVRREPLPPQWDEYVRRIGAGLVAAGEVVAPTRAMLDALGRCHGADGGHVVPNCSRTVRAALPPERRDRGPVLTAGRLWDEAKNVAALDRVARSLPVPVLIAGDAEHPAGSPRWQPAGARLLGHLDPPELVRAMQEAAVFALPARYEPFGLATLEAASAGCALVLGDIASLREVWDDAAAYVDPDDDEALRCAVAGLLDDPSRRRELARRAAERARTYTPERTAAGYLAVYGAARRTVGTAR